MSSDQVIVSSLSRSISAHHMDEWTAQGLMTREAILGRLAELAFYDIQYLNRESFENSLEKRFHSIAVKDATGTKRVDQEGFILLLQQEQDTCPALLQEVGSILLQWTRYLSGNPFHHELPQSLELQELRRAIFWLSPFEKTLSNVPWISAERIFASADCRRHIFQALSIQKRSDISPLKAEGSDQIARKCEDENFVLSMRKHGPEDSEHCNDRGDEIYHDMLDVLVTSQPSHSNAARGELRDSFRPLASSLHRGAPHLRELTIPVRTLRVFVKFLIYHTFGISDDAMPTGDDKYDLAVECIMRAFSFDSDVAVDWFMFEEGCKAAPFLFDALSRIICLFGGYPVLPSESLKIRLQSPGTLFTAPVLAQLNTLFKHDEYVWFDECQFLWYRDARLNSSDACDLMDFIRNKETPVLILVSGIETASHFRYLLGVFMPCPKRDSRRKQPNQQEGEPVRSLFELSPVQSIYAGTFGCPAWSIQPGDGGVIFGGLDHGVALLLDKNLRRARFVQNLGGVEKSIYQPSSRRGKYSIELDIDGVEVSCEPEDELQ